MAYVIRYFYVFFIALMKCIGEKINEKYVIHPKLAQAFLTCPKDLRYYLS